MPLLLYGADFVMTQRWGHKAKLEGELTQAHPSVTRTSSVAIPLSRRLSIRAAVSSQQLSAERKSTRFRANVIPQIKTLPGRYAIVLLTTLALISQPAMGKLWSNEQPDHVIFRSQICQPVSPANLKMLMGAGFDESKMASDFSTAKNMFGSATKDQDNDGYQGDDPRVDSVNDGYQGDDPRIDLVNDDIGDDQRRLESDDSGLLDEEGENIQKSNGVIEEKHSKRLLESRSWLPRRKMLNRHVNNRLSDNQRSRGRSNNALENNLADNSENKQVGGNSDSYTYMRRRRRSNGDRKTQSPAREQDNGDKFNDDSEGINDDDTIDNDGDIDAKLKKSTNSIQLQLLLNGKNKKQRKKLKKKLRQRPDFLSMPPAWECKFSQRQKQMSKGVFPEWILDGKCETKTCFYRLYECEEIKYTLKLLYRDPTQCNPLPSITNTTVFEERWELRPNYVTVGCNCVTSMVKNQKSKEQKKKH